MTRPGRAALAAFALALGACGGCSSVPKAPADWDPRLRAQLPPSVVALDGRAGLLSDWQASGVILHSSKEHGTYLLTAEHVAEEVARSGGARVHVFDAEKGTRRELRATNFFPTLESLRLLLEPQPEARTSKGTAKRALLDSLRASSGLDVALLRVETDELLPSAKLETRSNEIAPEPFFCATIYPERTPRLLHLGRRHPKASSAISEADAPAKHGNSGSGLFDADGRLCGLLWGGNEAIPAAAFVTLEPLAVWLGQTGTGSWITDGVTIDGSVVARAAAVSDRDALLRIASDREHVLYTVRTDAVVALGTAGALTADEAESFVKKELEPQVRCAALEAEIAYRPDHGDALAVFLLGQAERIQLEVAIHAIGRSGAALPRATEALEAISRGKDDREARAWAGIALVRRGATLASLPAELRAPVLEHFLTEVIEQPAEEGTLRAFCERVAQQTHAEGVLFDDGLGEIDSATTNVPAALESPADRIRLAFMRSSGPPVHVETHAAPDGTHLRVSVEATKVSSGKDQSP